MTTATKEEYLVIMGKGNLWPLKDRLKDLGGFYTGIFWAFPGESEGKLKGLMENFPELQIVKQPIPAGCKLKC